MGYVRAEEWNLCLYAGRLETAPTQTKPACAGYKVLIFCC